MPRYEMQKHVREPIDLNTLVLDDRSRRTFFELIDHKKRERTRFMPRPESPYDASRETEEAEQQNIRLVFTNEPFRDARYMLQQLTT